MKGSEGSKSVREGLDGQGGRLRDSLEGSETATDVLGTQYMTVLYPKVLSRLVDLL